MRSFILVVFLTLVLTATYLPAQAQGAKHVNKVDVGVSLNGKEIGPGDTIWAGAPASFDIYFENDDTLGGYSTGFTVYSPDGAAWAWRQEVLDYQLISSDPLKMDTIQSIVTTVKGSRHYPPSLVLDNGGLQVAYADTNGAPRDAILFGGTRRNKGVPPGPLEKVIQMHFVAGGIEAGKSATICIDSAKVGAVGEFVFVDIGGTTYVPQVLWAKNGRCWPVAKAITKK